jgi:hypothetical protein
VVSASDTHNRKNVNRSTEQSLDEIAVIIDEAHQRGVTCQVIGRARALSVTGSIGQPGLSRAKRARL